MAAIYLLIALVPGLLAVPSCDLTDLDELEYYCALNDESSIVVKTTVDSYINVKCNFYHDRDLNFTCADVPEINLANGLVVPSLSTEKCPPSILRCVTRAFNATGVTKLVLKAPTKPLQEDDVKYMDKLNTLLIRNGIKQSFPYFLLSHLPKLRDLRFLDTSLYFAGIQPVEHQSLRILHLLSAKIPEIPPGALEGLRNVTMFSISDNKFEILHSDALKGLDSLENFYCVNNPLKVIEPGIFTHTPKLVNLTLDFNSLESIPTGLFNGLEKLENVLINRNKSPLLLGNKTFANLPTLKKINLFHSQIQWLPEDMFTNTTKLNYIVLSYNHIELVPENIFLGLENLKGLDLSHNNIKQLSHRTFFPLKQLSELNLDWNHLEVLPSGLFPDQLSHLKILYLDHNRLHTINNHVFGKINLEVLSMASNLLGNEITYANLGDSTQRFPLINSLNTLILRNNSYDAILYEWWALYNQLQLLDLSRNNFTNLDANELQFNSIGITVDLRNNNISTVTLAYGINNSSAVNPTKNKTVLLDKNPFHCDCNIYQLLIRNGTIVPFSTIPEPAINVGNSVCVSPDNLKGQLVKYLSPNSVTCDLESECPEYCSSCKYRPATNSNEYHCQYIPNSLKSDYQTNGIVLKLDEQPNSIDNLVVRELNLSGLGINHVKLKPTPDLRVLDLSNNALVKPPIEFFNDNISLYLSGNKFECFCSYIDELKLMKIYPKIVDYDNITCVVGTDIVYFKDVNVATLCYNQKAVVTAAATFTVLLIVGIIVSVLVYKNFDKLQIYWMHKSIFARFYEDAEDLGKVYDCFISYSHKDSEFVEGQLIPKLENEFNQKTCIHYRDWDVGENILTQIHRSVESSRKTVIVLSEDFLKSMWATVEFNLAHSMALRECRARVILLLLGDVAEHPQLSEELKSYIKTNTYLSCSDQKFWEKLERALPARKKKFVWKKSVEENNKGGLNVQLNSDNKLVNVANKV